MFFPITLLGQFNPEAQEYLDQLAAAVSSAQGLEINFKADVKKISGEKEASNEKGTLLMSKNHSKLSMDGTEIYGDEENQWVYLTDENEVTIQPIEENEITPASIFTVYKKGYRFRLMKNENDTVIVELSPSDRNSEYVRITLNINTAKQQLNAFVAQSKNGIITTVTMTTWNEKTISENEIKFIESQHPDVEIIDLR